MAALATRGLLAAGQDYYLCPLSARQVLPTELQAAVAAVASGTQPVEQIMRPGTAAVLAYGFERLVEQCLPAASPGASASCTCAPWPSPQWRRPPCGGGWPVPRRKSADAPIRRQGKPRLGSATEVAAAVQTIVTRYAVAELLTWQVVSEQCERRVRGYQGRRDRVEHTTAYRVEVAANPAAVEAAVARLGWRVYVTNQPATELSFGQAVAAYRAEYLIEAQFGRLKGTPLSLSPLYVQRDAQRVGLVRLLSLALRGLSVLKYQVRRALQAQEEEVLGLYAGQPTRRSSRPWAERILHAFGPITLTRITLGSAAYLHVTPLTALQQQLLRLLGGATTIYEGLAEQSAKPP